MEYMQVRKLIVWLILTVILLLAFFLGILAASSFTEPIIFIIVLIVADYFIIGGLKLEGAKPDAFKKILIWLTLATNLIFMFLIGITIPFLESTSRNDFGVVMIPLLVVLNYIIVDRFHYYIKHSNERTENKDEL